MNTNNCVSRWIHVGITNVASTVGKDVLCYGGGCNLVFRNLLTQKKVFYHANSKNRGDGIKCFNGHKTSYFWAFSEACLDPWLYVKSYPDMETISVLKKDNKDQYLSIEFSEGSTLFSLEDFPNYRLSIWNWRTGEALKAITGDMFGASQIIRCSFSMPTLLAHLDVGHLGLRLNEINFCARKCEMLMYSIIPPRSCSALLDVLWTTEGGLFVLDIKGDVYSVDTETYKMEQVITFEGEHINLPAFCLHKGGILVVGPNFELRFYKKSGEWVQEWAIEMSVTLKSIISCALLLGLTDSDCIVFIDPIKNTISYAEQNTPNFTDIAVIRPVGEYCTALCNRNEIINFEVATGKMVARMHIDSSEGLVLRTNPIFPYLVVGCSNGFIELISSYRPLALKKMTKIYLTERPIDGLQFHHCGKVFVAASLFTGQFFILEGLPGGQIQVVGWVDGKRQFVSFFVVVSQEVYRIFALIVDNKKNLSGKSIVRYCLRKDQGFNERIYTFADQSLTFENIAPSFFPNRDKKFYMTPLSSRSICVVQIKRGSTTAQVVEKIPTGHQTGHVGLKISENYALTWAYDGFIIFTNNDLTECYGIAYAHHRNLGGVRRAVLTPSKRYILTLGQDNILVGTEVMKYENDTDYINQYTKALLSPQFELFFTAPTYGFDLTNKHERTYIEYAQDKVSKKEKELCGLEKDLLIKDFKILQSELKALLDANINGPDNEKLDLQEFMLDDQFLELENKKAVALRKEVLEYLKKILARNNEIVKWLITEHLDKAIVPGKEIKAMFDDIEVANFPIDTILKYLEDDASWVENFRMMEAFFNPHPFRPWKPDEPDIDKEGVYVVPKEEGEEKVVAVLPEEDEDEEGEQAKETPEELLHKEHMKEHVIAVSGTESGKFVHISPAIFSQREVHGYFQAYVQDRLTSVQPHRVKQYFNAEFNNVRNIKEREMALIKEKNDRLRYIVSEINYFNPGALDIEILDPEWVQTENPELIKQVANDEVPITPYISPSEQAILDAKAAEEERIRLLLLADDFKERALMVMMNGVLEVRWEDELKKDVPKPKCMIEKDPSEFKEDDIRQVREYEEKVKFMISERERYKNLLYAEFSKVAVSVKDGIKRFNSKLRDLYALKLRSENCVTQELLMLERTKYILYMRGVNTEYEKRLHEDIIKTEEKIHEITNHLVALQDDLEHECKPPLDALMIRDRVFEKNLKKDLSDVSAIVVEMAIKLWKKRPKTNIRSFTNASLLYDLGRAIIQHEILPCFNQEMLDYFNAMDTLDQYVGVPPQVEEKKYQQICKHRRLKIEHEMKIRAAQIDLEDSIQTIRMYQKRLADSKDHLQYLKSELNNVREFKYINRYNNALQMIIAQGIVEIKLTGKLSDFEDVVLINRNEVENINKIILGYGNKKLKQIQLEMTLHRKIMAAEWKHTYMRMVIDDFNEKMKDISSINMTKDIMAYLRKRKLGSTGDFTTFESQMLIIKNAHDVKINEIKQKIEVLQRKIQELTEDNRKCNRKIAKLNVDVCEFNLMKDHELDVKEKDLVDEKLKLFMKRSRLVNEITEKQNEIMMLQTELELIRLKTFPTLKYKVICKT